MAPFVKAFTLSALVCRAAVAATCDEPSDETSFVQVKQMVQPGNERIPTVGLGWPTPVTNMKAVADSVPDSLDHGQVMDSFATNTDKVRSEIEAKAADAIDFTNQEREARQTSRQEAADAVKQFQEAAARRIQEDREAVKETAVQRAAVVKAAVDRVKDAKERQEAHNIKRLQAEHAAVLGRVAGTMEGRDAAKHAWMTYKKDVALKGMAMRRAFLKAQRRKREMLAAAVVNRGTKGLALKGELLSRRSHRMAKAAIANANARSSIAENAIGGPEGLKNTLTNVKADWAAEKYGLLTAHEQEKTDEAATGVWPYTDWPLGP